MKEKFLSGHGCLPLCLCYLKFVYGLFIVHSVQPIVPNCNSWLWRKPKSAVKAAIIVESCYQINVLISEQFFLDCFKCFNIKFLHYFGAGHGADLSLGCFTGW